MIILNNLRRFFCPQKATQGDAATERTPSLIANRKDDKNSAALIFVHGFQGDLVSTWSYFFEHLLNDLRLSDWDVYSVGYRTKLSIDLPLWTSDPKIQICATALITKVMLAPLDRYKAITLVGHSMGGLVVQRAILDSRDLRQRLRHVILYGTPSAGTAKAALGARLKAQARDMAVGSKFITRLRADWQEQIGENPPFSFTAVAGETDAFIPPSSSIDPFPVSQQAVVPGDHLEIVRPDSTTHPSYELLYKTLTGSRGALTAVESARLAIEHKEYERAIELLLPNADGLDANAIVTLSLALESVGRESLALEVIQSWNKANTPAALDPIGVLAGRLKRRWLVSRQHKDFDKAFDLYTTGLKRAEEEGNFPQAYYHAINIACLLLVNEATGGPASTEVQGMATRALEYVRKSHQSAWSLATEGEARLMLGDLQGGGGSLSKG